MATVAVLDQQKARNFGARLLTSLNDGALCLMISIGHRTGLFDTMRDLPPMTSEELAHRVGLKERYVREWLGAMLTGGVVEVDPFTTNRFILPPEHATCLTRVAGADNGVVFAQYIPALGAVEDDIVECFKKGGGVPYSKFPRFHEVMEDSGQSVLSSLETHILPLVPGLQDRLAEGARLLDVGCGRGRILIRLAELYPKSSFWGIDLSEEAVDYARRLVSDMGLSRETG